MTKQILFGEGALRRLDAQVHAFRSVVEHRDPGVLPAYERLLAIVRSQSRLLSRPGLLVRDPQVNLAILAMALHHADWLVPAEAWTPSGKGRHSELASLAAHLFARYPMPRFMVMAWLAGSSGEVVPEHGWYKLLGRGENIRRAGIPMRITRGMAHRFLSAADHLTPIQALRWAQVRELGGDDAERLARCIFATHLGREIENEEFWETVVHFLVRHPELELESVGPIVDFLQHQKFTWREGVTPTGSLERIPPPQPDFSMKGRTPAALLRLVEDWHAELGRNQSERVQVWPRAPVGEARWVEQTRSRDGDLESRVWTFSELCSSHALFTEGKLMHHCVASYAEGCVRRISSIWSLQIETRSGRHPVLTVELHLPSRTVVQARGKFNRWPTQAERAVLSRWARQERLRLPETLDVD